MKSAAVTVLILSLLSGIANAQTIKIKRQCGGYLVSEGSKKVLFYQSAPKSLNGTFRRANYVHPLFDLDGNVVSEDFPEDHPHHRGIFWGWHQLWIGDQKIGNSWSTKDSVWDVQKVQRIRFNDRSVGLKSHILWKSPDWKDPVGRLKPVVSENTTIRVYPSDQESRKIDFEIRLTARENNMRIGGADNSKGYGGFSVRLHLPNPVQFQSRLGPVAPQRTSVEAGPWINVPDSLANNTGGFAILSHPSLPGFPHRWILRSHRGMQNPVYPGQIPVPLSTDEPLVLRYRLVIYRGQIDVQQAEVWQSEYEESS